MSPSELSLGLALPELFLAVAGMVLLMYGVFRGDQATNVVSWSAIAAFAIAALLIPSGAGGRAEAFGGMFVVDRFGAYMKLLVLLGSSLTLIMSMDFNRREGIVRFEFPVLFVFATLGMLMMISANDLIALYIGLELQSLSLYVVAAFRRDSIKSTEAGLKYFVLGALSSGMLLYGASLIYGFSGTTDFGVLATALILPGETSLGVLFGLVFVAAALAFKVSAAPFHMWTPDVYEGAPTPVTAFFSVAPKIAAVALLVRVMIEPFGGLTDDWRQVIVAISIASMLLGAFAAINQNNIKRLMAYSSIGNVGYALIGLAAGDDNGVRGVIVYMAIYLFMNVAAFAVILSMRRQGRMVEDIPDLAGLARTRPLLAAGLGTAMFSMAGIPPLAGFFGKLYVFLAAIQAELYTLAVIGVLSSVVAAFYYLRIVKIMYFDDPAESFDRPANRAVGIILAAASAFLILFFLRPGLIIDPAEAAAASLFTG
jgi:NADH-quinone oxidoreductase subunit N